MTAVGQPASQNPAARRPSLGSVAARILLHGGFLLIAVGCFAAYEHFKIGGQSAASLASLAAAAGFGFAPVRDLVRLVFGIEGKVLHLVHGLGGLALVALPLAGVVSGAPVLTHAAMAPFAIMGAAQAFMHQDHPRNAKQAGRCNSSRRASRRSRSSPARRTSLRPRTRSGAVAVLSDIIAKAQALGETELASDPRFQSALRQVSTRFGANLGLDAVDLALAKPAANPVTAGAVPELRKQLASARRTIANAGSR